MDERLVHWQYDQNTGLETARQFYHRDHQGSIIAMSDGAGNRPVGELYTYDAYGNMVTGNTTGQPFRYTGRRWDDETGLYYYRARYYSAELGRFLQTDPIGYEDNMNLYGYTANDPVNGTDPFGLETTIPTSCPSDGPLICGFFGDDDEEDDDDNPFEGLFDFSRFIGMLSEETKKEAGETAQEIAETTADVALTTLQCAANETGLDTLFGAVLAASGANVIPTRGKFGGSTPGTSPASVTARKLAGNAKFPAGVRVPAPTVNAPFATTAKVGTAAGRLAPLVGLGLLVKDAFNTVGCVAEGGVSNGE